MIEKPTLEKITYLFSQEGNGNGSTEEYEELEISVEGSCECVSEHGGFLVIRSGTGWSINDASELIDVLKLVEQGVGSKPKEIKE